MFLQVHEEWYGGNRSNTEGESHGGFAKIKITNGISSLDNIASKIWNICGRGRFNQIYRTTQQNNEDNNKVSMECRITTPNICIRKVTKECVTTTEE